MQRENLVFKNLSVVEDVMQGGKSITASYFHEVQKVK